MSKFEKALRSIKVRDWDFIDHELVECEKSIESSIFKNEDGVICVSAEDGAGLADYYGEFRGGFPWIHPEIEAVAEKHNMHIEWQDAGSLGFYS